MIPTKIFTHIIFCILQQNLLILMKSVTLVTGHERWARESRQVSAFCIVFFLNSLSLLHLFDCFCLLFEYTQPYTGGKTGEVCSILGQC